jgi:hypothetical protein
MLAEDVAQLLLDHGSDLSLTRLTPGAYSPSTGQMSAPTITTHTIRGVFINYNLRNVDNTVVRMGDRMLLVSATGSATAPVMDDRVDGLAIVDVRTIAPNGVPIAWICQARA